MQSHKPELHLEYSLYDAFGNKLFTKQHNHKEIAPAEISIVVKDNKGRIVKEHKQPMRSLLGNYIKSLFIETFYLTQTPALQMENIADIFCGRSSSGNCLISNGGAGNNYGIVIGADPTAVTATQNKLFGVISHGSGTGQLNYSAMTFYTSTAITGGYQFEIKRQFTNSTTNTIYVKEVGLYGSWDTTNRICYARDVLDSSGAAINIGVTAGQTIEVRYTFQIDQAGLFNKVFFDMLYGKMSGTSVTMKSTDGMDRTMAHTTYYPLAASANDSTYGLTLGTFSSPQSVDSYQLGNRIIQGTSSGQLEYLITEVVPYSEDPTFAEFGVKRKFTNRSGAPIVVNEVGLSAKGSVGSYEFLFSRAAVSPITIGDQQTIEVKFVVRATTMDIVSVPVNAAQ
jgi:hypothetical protein